MRFSFVIKKKMKSSLFKKFNDFVLKLQKFSFGDSFIGIVCDIIFVSLGYD